MILYIIKKVMNALEKIGLWFIKDDKEETEVELCDEIDNTNDATSLNGFNVFNKLNSLFARIKKFEGFDKEMYGNFFNTLNNFKITYEKRKEDYEKMKYKNEIILSECNLAPEEDLNLYQELLKVEFDIEKFEIIYNINSITQKFFEFCYRLNLLYNIFLKHKDETIKISVQYEKAVEKFDELVCISDKYANYKAEMVDCQECIKYSIYLLYKISLRLNEESEYGLDCFDDNEDIECIKFLFEEMDGLEKIIDKNFSNKSYYDKLKYVITKVKTSEYNQVYFSDEQKKDIFYIEDIVTMLCVSNQIEAYSIALSNVVKNYLPKEKMYENLKDFAITYFKSKGNAICELISKIIELADENITTKEIFLLIKLFNAEEYVFNDLEDFSSKELINKLLNEKEKYESKHLPDEIDKRKEKVLLSKKSHDLYIKVPIEINNIGFLLDKLKISYILSSGVLWINSYYFTGLYSMEKLIKTAKKGQEV